MTPEVLTRQGRIRSIYQPAVYFDSSVLIDYWLTEGLEVDLEATESPRPEESHVFTAVRDLVAADGRLSKVVEIRRLLMFGNPRAIAVFTPLGLLELTGRHAEANFKQIAGQAAGVLNIQRKSRKDIGKLLSDILKRRRAEIANGTTGPFGCSTAMEILIAETMLNSSFARAHGLRGLSPVDLRKFSLTIPDAFDLPFYLSYLQVGVADVLHILAAAHLRCAYIASFDRDFTSNGEAVLEATGITILGTPEEVLNVLQGTSPPEPGS